MFGRRTDEKILKSRIAELEDEVYNLQILIDNKNELLAKVIGQRDLYWNNLTDKRKEKLVANLNEND